MQLDGIAAKAATVLQAPSQTLLICLISLQLLPPQPIPGRPRLRYRHTLARDDWNRTRLAASRPWWRCERGERRYSSDQLQPLGLRPTAGAAMIEPMATPVTARPQSTPKMLLSLWEGTSVGCE
jgi:hypothetical protein